MFHYRPFVFVLIAALLASCMASPKPACRTFREIYGNGKNLCEKMWDDAFMYEPKEEKGFTMWFTGSNPNEDTARRLNDTKSSGNNESAPAFRYGTDECHLEYYHKEFPSREPETFSECHPWQEKSCCAKETVQSAKKLKEGYGKEFHWDRCGPLSRACEAFFVEEACFYECDPTIGLYRKHPEHIFNPDDKSKVYSEKELNDLNEWQVWKMPIKASYCDAWFRACENDLFCAENQGSFFSCAAVYEAHDDSAKLPTGAIVAIAVLGGLAFLGLLFGAIVIRRERAGNPMFVPIPTTTQEPHIGGQV